MSSLEYAKLGYYIVTKLASVKPNENVLILGETASNEAMMQAVMAASIGIGAETQMLIYPERKEINVEHPKSVAEAMKHTDVIIDFSVKYTIHTIAYQEARKAGTRALVTIPQGIEEYIKDGIVGIDYDKMVEEGGMISKLFERCSKCRLASDEGTELEMELGNRPAVLRDGMVIDKGEIDYFPGAQISLAPVEESINGKVVVNGSLYPPVGILDHNVTVTMKKGRIVKIEGSVEAQVWEKWIAGFDDPKMYCVAHFSIGLNPNAKLSGYIIEDERIRGSIIFGFGSQMPDFKGKVGKAKSHTDAVSLFNTVFLDDKKVVAKGDILKVD
jgi:2,5-dihydroxypyridine 5,6-dioxygenase